MAGCFCEKCGVYIPYSKLWKDYGTVEEVSICWNCGHVNALSSVPAIELRGDC